MALIVQQECAYLKMNMYERASIKVDDDCFLLEEEYMAGLHQEIRDKVPVILARIDQYLDTLDDRQENDIEMGDIEYYFKVLRETFVQKVAYHEALYDKVQARLKKIKTIVID
jgi:hypothetical protein